MSKRISAEIPAATMAISAILLIVIFINFAGCFATTDSIKDEFYQTTEEALND